MSSGGSRQQSALRTGSSITSRTEHGPSWGAHRGWTQPHKHFRLRIIYIHPSQSSAWKALSSSTLLGMKQNTLLQPVWKIYSLYAQLCTSGALCVGFSFPPDMLQYETGCCKNPSITYISLCSLSKLKLLQIWNAFIFSKNPITFCIIPKVFIFKCTYHPKSELLNWR